MFTYLDFDDFVSVDVQEEIEAYLHKRMMWKYVRNVSGYDLGSILPDEVDVLDYQGGLTGYIMATELNWPLNREMMNILEPMISRIYAEIPLPIEITRVRAGMFTRYPNYGIHNPHVDFLYPHYTLLYYANDSDGDTLLFNEKINPLDPSVAPEKYTVMNSFSPRRGRAVLFNGLHYHSSSSPIFHDTRVAININIRPTGE